MDTIESERFLRVDEDDFKVIAAQSKWPSISAA